MGLASQPGLHLIDRRGNTRPYEPPDPFLARLIELMIHAIDCDMDDDCTCGARYVGA